MGTVGGRNPTRRGGRIFALWPRGIRALLGPVQKGWRPLDPWEKLDLDGNVPAPPPRSPPLTYATPDPRAPDPAHLATGSFPRRRLARPRAAFEAVMGVLMGAAEASEGRRLRALREVCEKSPGWRRRPPSGHVTPPPPRPPPDARAKAFPHIPPHNVIVRKRMMQQLPLKKKKKIEWGREEKKRKGGRRGTREKGRER